MMTTTSFAAEPHGLPKLSSAAGIISLLSDNQIEIRVQAINSLNTIVDYFWPEIADVSSQLERLAYDDGFPAKQLAALVLAKVYFNMEKWSDSIRLSLISGPLFDLGNGSMFTKTILNKAIDLYVESKAAGRPVDPALEGIVEEMLRACVAAQDYEQVIGIALDAHRLDVLETVLKVAQPVGEHLRYVQKQVLCFGRSLDFQQRVLELLIGVAEAQPEVDYVFICDCLVSTHDVPKCSAVLVELASHGSSKAALLLALQIAFNIYEVGSEFARKVCQHLKAKLCDGEAYKALWSNWNGSPGEKLVGILSGVVPSELSVRFLAKANNADLLVLEKTREALNLHNSQHHSAVYYANGLMHSGSTNDEFLRKNMDWLSYASNWAKFNAAASLGMLHHGHAAESKTVLAPYLPKPGSTGSPYAEGGALLALGLIHAKSEASDLGYMKEQLNATSNEVAQHGACLGIGAMAMASHDASILDDLRGVLYGDNAVSGEAAALSLGLVMAGSMDAGLTEELLQYARETQHEKIIRSLTLAVALVFYGAKDKAEPVIEQMLNDKDGIIRFGAVWTIAMAYAGTSDNSAVRRLLHAAVSESDDDVRRSAVIALGFVLFRNPKELPRLLELLAASYNPNVRYGVAMALGIAFCGTGDQAAIDLIKPMCKDLTDFVRQGAYLALALILQQVAEANCDQVAPTRKLLETVAGSKYEDAIARFGAILAQGLIDAGGRNATLTLASPGAPQHNNLIGICATMVFCQFWYWYPCIGFLSLALEPTGMLGVDETLKAPQFDFISAAPPSLFAYPEAIKQAQAAAPKKLTTAVLSTTAKAVARAKKAGKSTDMEIDSAAAASSVEPSPALNPIEIPDAPVSPDLSMVEEEPSHVMQGNFTRITGLQRPHIQFQREGTARFLPIIPWAPFIYTVVQDAQPGLPVEYLEPPKLVVKDEPTAAQVVEKTAEADVPMAPQPFEEPDI